MPDRLPNVLILGAQKAGTTSLAAWLGEQPRCWLAPEKEVHFFDIHFDRGVAWYRSRFRAAPDDAIVGEATPYYLFHPRCAERIAASLPDAQLIVILRDPVERALSSYFHAVQHGHEPLSIEDALDAEAGRLAKDAARMDADPLAYGEHHQWNSYQSRGRYAEQLRRYLKLFPRDRLHIAFFEELVHAPKETLDAIARFLHLASHGTHLPKINAGTYRSTDVPAAVRTRLSANFAEANADLAALLDRPLPWPDVHTARDYHGPNMAEVTDDAVGVRKLGHRAFTGGDGPYWDLIGDLQFRFLVDQGLKPEHVLLDVACGSLRGGTRFIKYLEPHHYLGFDKSIDLVILGVVEELSAKLFIERAPQFVINGQFNFSEFTRKPDFALAQSLFTHLTPEHCRNALAGVASVAKPETRFYVSYFPIADAGEANPDESHSRLVFRYRPDELASFGAASGWAMRDLGAWNHPRGQHMALFLRR